MKKNKTKPLRLWDPTRPGHGISKSEKLPQGGFKRFFITMKDNFGKLTSVNLIMVLGNFPLIFLLIAYFAPFCSNASTVPLADSYQNLFGLLSAEGVTSGNLALIGTSGLQKTLYSPTVFGYIFYALSALVVFTFGLVNCGTAYVLRNIAKGDPAFVKDDFCYAVKRNWKQALPFGILDCLIIFILCINIYSLIFSSSAFLADVMFWMNVLITILYFVMRFYIYVQMVTFNLSVFKIIRNSLIFTLIGTKRNLCALGGILAVLLILTAILISLPLGVSAPILIILPLTVLLALFAYAKVYAAWFKIKEIMIDPYQEEKEDETAEDEPLMHDDVTEAERLRKIREKNGLPAEE